MTADAALQSHAIKLAPSRFNFKIPTSAGPLLFNTASGAVMALRGLDGEQLAEILTQRVKSEALSFEEILPDESLRDLSAGGYLVPAAADEILAIRDRYWRARVETPVVLTLTTTLDCNLGCYYCYEDRSSNKLALEDVESIVSLAKRKLAGRRSLHIDWYGGEPLMNLEFIEAASPRLQQCCQEGGIAYAASVISNGTSWPEDAASFVKRHAIRQVQISFDGLKANHDRRRRFRGGHGKAGDSSFDLAVSLVDKLVHCVRVDIRFNIDRANQSDLSPFLEFAEGRGWFSTEHRATFQPARLSAYSERSSFMRNSELSVKEYDAIRGQIRALAKGKMSVDESEVPDGFPYPRTSVCAALAKDSVVVGADQNLYRCGLQVSEPARSVGRLFYEARRTSLPVIQDSDDGNWWEAFDPTRQSRCSRCSFLPICWGGCPKKHLERDTHALREQGAYWRRNLARLVTEGVGLQTVSDFEYSEFDQFRDGLPEDEIPPCNSK